MLYEKKMIAFGYAREREQFIENAREKCRNWRNEFENQFKTSCDLSLAEFGPLAADLCIMVLITVLFYMKNFKLYFVILLALEGTTLGYNLFIILETIMQLITLCAEVGKNPAKLERTKRSWKVSLEVGKFHIAWFFPTSLGSFQLQRNFPTSDFPT